MQSIKEIKKLEANLHRDKHTQEVIKEGTVKEEIINTCILFLNMMLTMPKI